MVISVAKKLPGLSWNTLLEVNLRDVLDLVFWCFVPFFTKSEWQHYISVLSGCIRPLNLYSNESGKWMYNLGCYLVVIHVSFPGRTEKFAMAAMLSPNSSLKIYDITVWLFKSSHLQSWSHSYPVCLYISLTLSFFFPLFLCSFFCMGSLFMMTLLLDVVCCRHKTFKSCLNRSLNHLSWGLRFLIQITAYVKGWHQVETAATVFKFPGFFFSFWWRGFCLACNYVRIPSGPSG